MLLRNITELFLIKNNTSAILYFIPFQFAPKLTFENQSKQSNMKNKLLDLSFLKTARFWCLVYTVRFFLALYLVTLVVFCCIF